MSEHLEHHGIKGQKWGVQNGPPYPLDEEAKKDYNEHVKEEGSGSSHTDQKIVNKMSQKHTEKNDPWFDTFMNGYIDEENVLNRYPIEDLDKLARLDDDESLTDISDEYSGGAGARYFINHGADNEEGEAGREYNCQNCALAFDMLERGYRVKARPRYDGSNVGDIAKYFEGGKLEHNGDEYDWYTVPKSLLNQEINSIRGVSSFAEQDAILEKYQQYHDREWKEFRAACGKAVDDMETKMKDFGNGTRGIIVVGWPKDAFADAPKPTEQATSFHAFNWKVEDGSVIYYDTQSRRKWKYDSGYTNEEFRTQINPNELYFMRTDNLQPSKNIGECVYSRTRKEDKKNDA